MAGFVAVGGGGVMGIFRRLATDDFYNNLIEMKDSPDPEDKAIAKRMDDCPNNPRNGGDGYFKHARGRDRR